MTITNFGLVNFIVQGDSPQKTEPTVDFLQMVFVCLTNIGRKK